MQVVDDYLAELTRRLQAILGDDLVAVYAGGSYALGAYDHGPSDVDVTAVVARPLDDATKHALVGALRHEALPCPARGLELVLYPLATARAGTGEPGFELNLNTGARMDFRADLQPGDIEHFWFAIDRSILREHGIPLHGPPSSEIFAPIPRATLAPLLADSMRAQQDPVNDARAQHFLDTGQWISKRDARQRLDGGTPPP
jgi:hypothetical protein